MRTPGSRLLASILITSLLMPACHATQQVDSETPIGTVQQPSGVDSDCDGIPDAVELQYGLDPMNPDDADADPDGDDVSTLDEIRLGSNPLVADSDGNGVPDGIDLQAGRDLDGDGVPTPFDNCPKDPNKTQRDSDGDGVGDACDRDAPSVAIAEAYARPTNDYALLPLRGGVVSRHIADRGELLPMPSSFRVFASAGSAFASHGLRELYHSTTKDHAYVTLDIDRDALVRVGYVDQGVLGYLADGPLPFDGSVAVRRFAHSTLKQEAVTIDATTAQQLLAQGYVEQPKLGYAILDNGHLRHPRSITRYRRTGTTDSFRHQSTPIVVTGYTSDGPRFRVLPEKIGNARALFRMRNNAYERLSADPTEVAQYLAQGYANDGVLGWILAAPDALPTQPGIALWRLEQAGKHRYSIDSVEIDGLVQAGWVKTRLLGYAFASRERPATCAGPTAVQRLESKLVGMAAHPEERAVATLTAIVASCSLERVLDGNVPANPIEQSIANKLPIDPEVRRRLRLNAARWDAIDPGLRAQALDRYAALDPGPCAGPIDVAALRDHVHDLWFDYSGPPPSLREPFCDGTTYAPADPAAGTQVAARAVTVDAVPNGEFGDSNAAKPRLQGVLATEFVRGHPAAQAWANAHPDVGFSVTGVATGLSCSATMPCAASQGLRCVSGMCLAYPIVRNQQLHTLTGTNFWDVIDGDVVLRDTVTGAVSRIPDEIISNEPSGDQRCSQFGTTNRATIEDPLSLTKDRFYEVEVVNKNGLYYEHAETVPPDDATARANGRTIHVCWRASDPNRPPDTITDCSLVNTSAAACPLDGPICSATTGGVWGGAGQPPRSLQFCQQNGLDCGETPREFSSRPATVNARQYIYVESAPPVKTVTTMLQDVTCHNETGTDWLGSDELAVMLTAFAGAAVAPGAPGLDISADAYQHSYDSGDNHTQLGQVLASIKIDESSNLSTGSASYLLSLLEDDDGLIGTLVGLAIIAIAAAVVAYTWPSTAVILTAAGIAVLLGAAWTALMTNKGENDPLGSDVFFTTIADVTDRGVMSHDLAYNTLPPLPSFDDAMERSYAGANEVGVHPAVDGDARTENSEVTGIECAATTDCSSSEVCAIGLCVPRSWWDAAPASGGNPPGFIERREFLNGGKWRYDLYLSWKVTQ